MFCRSGTYYDVGLGACGKTNQDSELVAAVSHTVFDQYPWVPCIVFALSETSS
jgi:hypothetical protein